MDPLQGSVTDDQKNSSYYRGFLSAEKRRPIVHREPTLGSMIVSGIFAALPVVGMYYIFMRPRNFSSGPGKQAMGTTQKAFKSYMDAMMGNNKRNFLVEVKDTKFKDVIGVPEALDEVRQYVQFLQAPQKFTRLGARLPKGCLLTGEPGTGKTLLAKAVAGEADVPFFTCSGADFIEVYVGSGPKRIRELFGEAKKAAPSVIFIDEIDAVGKRGGSQMNQSSGEENRTINQLLAELDGMTASEHVVVFAATNFPDNLDKALLREGRFDRKVDIPMPDKHAREELFKFYLDKVITGDPRGTLFSKIPKQGNVNITEEERQKLEEQRRKEGEAAIDPDIDNYEYGRRLAELTPGCSPARISTIVNEAALTAAHEEKKVVELPNLLSSIDNVIVGKKHRSRMTEEATRRIALHESGHALVAWLLPTQRQVIKLSITPRGSAGGFTQQLGREIGDAITDQMLFTDICVMLGGRCAELMLHDNLTTGASDDVQRATQNARNQFLAFGMSAEIGHLAFDYNRLDQGRDAQHMSQSLQGKAEKEAAKMIAAAFEVTQELLRTNKEKLLSLTAELVEKKEMLQEDIEKVVGPRPDHGAALPGRAQQVIESFTEEAGKEGRKVQAFGGKVAAEKQAPVTMAEA